MSMVGIIGLLLAIAILIFGAYKGLGALPLTMIAALVAIVFNGIPLWEGFATHYMAGYTSAYMSYFLMFACSALYAKLMDESGCATAIGYKFIDWFGRKNIMLVTILIVSVLTYGGVSLFVVVYAVAPIMFLLFKEANLPRHLTMACLIVGSATYTMTTLPGTPQLTNVVPTEYLGTTMTAAPVLSIICTVAIFALCLLYCTWAKNRAVARGEVWSYPDNVDPALFEIKDRSLLPPAWKAFLPIVVLLLVIIVGGRFVSNSTMLATCAMLLGAVLTYVLNFTQFKGKDWKALLGDGLELYLTPGHSRGGQTIVVPTEKGRYVITGDNSATKYCLFADMDKMTLMDGTVINITPDHTIPHLTGRFTTDRFAFAKDEQEFKTLVRAMRA